MKYAPAVALIVAMFAWPALAQHGSAYGGSFGGRGGGGQASFSPHSGISARPSFSAPRGISARPAISTPRNVAPSATFHYGPLGPPPSVRFNPPRLTPPHPVNPANNYIARPAYRAGFTGSDSRIWNSNGPQDWDHDGDRGRRHDWDHDHDGDHRGPRDRDHDGDRDRFHGRQRSFQNWYLYSYPAWFGYTYPYSYDSGFYDSSNYDNSAYDQSNQLSGDNSQVSGYQPEYPPADYSQPGGENDGQYAAQPPPWPGPATAQSVPENPPANTGVSAAFAPPLEGPLTVVFKGNRAPEKIQNYMVTASALTDLDAGHYEQIPLTQIDITATAQANRSSGLEFNVPGAPSRD